MLKDIKEAYLDAIKLLFKKPLAILVVFTGVLINVLFSIDMDYFEHTGGISFLLQILNIFMTWTIHIFLFWLVFVADVATSLSLSEWFKEYFLRTILQFLLGFFLFFPFFMGVRAILGETTFALANVHSFVILLFCLWIFISVILGTLWLCFRDDGLLNNVKNAIKDVFRNFRYYIFLELITLVWLFLYSILLTNTGEFSGLRCGLLVVYIILILLGWMATAFIFLRLRKLEE